MYIRLIVFTLIIVCSSLFFILPGHEWIKNAFISSGYYFIFATTLLWTVQLLKVYYNEINNSFKNHLPAILLSIVLTIIIFTVSPPKFKVLSDESNLTGVSMSLYHTKTAHYPYQGINFKHNTFKVDKRPLLYPFLTSIVHSLFGYHVENSFIVNIIASIFLLFSCYLFLTFFLPKFYATISILLMAGNPIYIFWTTSGGFETLNLLFILLVLILSYRFLLVGNIRNAELLFLTLLMLLQCRYESLLFLIIIIFLLPYLFNQKMVGKYTFITYMLPILIMPIFWQRKLFNESSMMVKTIFGIHEIPNLISAFSLNNFISNSNSNVFVLLGIDPAFGFSPVISLLSIVGLYLLARKLLLNFKKLSIASRYLLIICLITFLLLIIVIFSYHWGNFLLPASNRFALVFLPYLVFSAIYAITKITEKLQNHNKLVIITVFLIFHMIYFLPYGIQQERIKPSGLPKIYQKTLNYLKSHYSCNNEELLVITDNPNLYMIHRYGAVNFNYANKNTSVILDNYYKHFKHVVIFQRYTHLFSQPSVNNRLKNIYKFREKGMIKINPSKYIKVSELINNPKTPALKIKEHRTPLRQP